MKHLLTIIVVLALVLAAGTAYAGPLDTAKTWLTDTAVLAVIGFVLGIGAIAVWTDWISVLGVAIGYLVIAVGQLIVTSCMSVFDHKITKDEIDQIKREFGLAKTKLVDVFAAARARPGASPNV